MKVFFVVVSLTLSIIVGFKSSFVGEPLALWSQGAFALLHLACVGLGAIKDDPVDDGSEIKDVLYVTNLTGDFLFFKLLTYIILSVFGIIYFDFPSFLNVLMALQVGSLYRFIFVQDGAARWLIYTKLESLGLNEKIVVLSEHPSKVWPVMKSVEN